MSGLSMRRLLQACLSLAAFLALAATAQPEVYEPGVHYQELRHPLEDRDAERIEVAELFWYGCPNCYDMLPTLQLWESSYRSSDMSFQRLPVIWNDSMETHARMYLAAEALGLLPTVNKSSWEIIPTIHNDFFDALHVDNQALLSDTDLLPLFESRGISRESFERAWNSPAVLTRLEELKSMQAFSEVPTLPALVVHGRYIVTLNEAVTSVEHLIKVMNFLVGKVREEGSPRE